MYIFRNCFRWSWQFSWPTSGPRLNQSSAYYQLNYTSIFCLRRPISGTRRRANCSRQWTDSVIISLVGPTSDQLGWTNRGPTVNSHLGMNYILWVYNFSKDFRNVFKKFRLFKQLLIRGLSAEFRKFQITYNIYNRMF